MIGDYPEGTLRPFFEVRGKVEDLPCLLVIHPDDAVPVHDNNTICRGLYRCPLEGVCLPEFGGPLPYQALKMILIFMEFLFCLLFTIDKPGDGSKQDIPPILKTIKGIMETTEEK